MLALLRVLGDTGVLRALGILGFWGCWGYWDAEGAAGAANTGSTGILRVLGVLGVLRVLRVLEMLGVLKVLRVLMVLRVLGVLEVLSVLGCSSLVSARGLSPFPPDPCPSLAAGVPSPLSHPEGPQRVPRALRGLDLSPDRTRRARQPPLLLLLTAGMQMNAFGACWINTMFVLPNGFQQDMVNMNSQVGKCIIHQQARSARLLLNAWQPRLRQS